MTPAMKTLLDEARKAAEAAKRQGLTYSATVLLNAVMDVEDELARAKVQA